jgi:CBS domain containing-hemolysin-like protein
MPRGLALTLTIVLLLANAFFVASEFAIVKIRPTRLKELVAQGRRRARLLQAITGRLDGYLSVFQLGITLCSLGIGWLGEPAFADLIAPHVVGLGEWAGVTAHGLAIGVAFAVITFLHTAFGELAPKSLAIQRTEPVALWAAVPMRVFYILTFPVSWVLSKAANLLLRLIGLRPASEAELVHSPDELRLVLQHVKLDPGARRLIDRVFDYTHRVARHVMTLRRDTVVLVAGKPFEENLKTALANQYTRYPLVDPVTDRVIGYVHLKDIFAAVASGKPPGRMRDLVREPIYAAEETRLEWLRREFQRRRVHIAIVLGKGQKFVGIVTLEDLLEEFVGEIQDEQDLEEVPPVVRRPDGSFEADGRLTLDVAARDLGLVLEPPRPEIETLGAFFADALGEAPVPGDELDVAGYRLTVLDVRDGRIRRVRGEPLPPESTDRETAASPDATGP